MKAALKHDHSHYPTHWRALPNGELLQQSIAANLAVHSRLCFGYHLLKIGRLTASIELSECTIKHTVTLTQSQEENSSVVGKATDLPFAENSIDAVVTALELDFCADPHQVLREIDRVITPNGHLMLIGLNPFSMDWLLSFLPFKRYRSLRHARYFRQGRVTDWLHLLGFEVIKSSKIAHFCLLFNSANAAAVKLNRWCAKYFPWSGAAYVIIARKREIPLSLVKPSWRLKPKFSAIGASATVQTRN
ncbi:class I SAM-dependent methyltransferase [Alteromonas flava]|uniref:class I SAM-dependent methyltransferase n=1 Tax=Alteromonas flava TaxID=2048003 RepID=UPI000C2909E3|nr:class I SAM-dependent methyltransferase [Alteromonas flava]